MLKKAILYYIPMHIKTCAPICLQGNKSMVTEKLSILVLHFILAQRLSSISLNLPVLSFIKLVNLIMC